MKLDNYIRPKSVIHDGLARVFISVRFVEICDALNDIGTNFDDDIAYLSDVDYLGYVGDKAFGIQIKPTTANRATDRTNFGNHYISERTKSSFADFTADFSGKVGPSSRFIIFSLDGEIGNPEIIGEIADEIARLRS